GDSFLLDYRYIREVPEVFAAFPKQNHRFKEFAGEFDSVNQLTGGARVAITREWSLSYRIAYSFERNVMLANVGSVDYVSRCGCWSAGVVLRQSRSRGASVSFSYSLLGLGDDSRRSIAPSSSGPRSLLDAFGGV
ncbi:MAG: hypothetical protein QF391_09800, partial [Myxococcota bacterium]|nr:hypothetical protein [Myxococcota bacterium]